MTNFRQVIEKSVSGQRITHHEALLLADDCDGLQLIEAASAIRDRQHGSIVTYSPKVFIPLTQLCRDVCHYCTFSRPPKRNTKAFLIADEILAIAHSGVAAGCHEALFTLGDKPELRYSTVRTELKALGYPSTIAYLSAMAELVYKETGLLPHVNPGVVASNEIAELRKVSVSQGIMLESSSTRLCEKGGPHYGSPDKNPVVRLATIAAAGAARVPTTSGILIGIGETRQERVEALLALRDLHEAHGHIQEVIIQNFRRKPGTKMHNAPEPDLGEMLWTIAVARIIFGAGMNIQAPPNLSPESLPEILQAGINDWGGISPVTPDHVNPEAPWPHLEVLAQITESLGKTLVPRLPVYPEYIDNMDQWVDSDLHRLLLEHMDAEKYARTDGWSPGIGIPAPATTSASLAVEVSDLTEIIRTAPKIKSGIQTVVDKAFSGTRLSEKDIVELFRARGRDFDLVCSAANEMRAAVKGNTVTYVVNRNINYTNICYFHCKFCAFSKASSSNNNLRGKGYDLSLEEIQRRTLEARSRGAVEVCLQGGIHPDYTGQTYLDITRAIKEACPEMHIHAFSALEVAQGAQTLGMSLRTFLNELKKAGLDTMPGTAAEVLDDEVRNILCPDKLNTAQWLDIIRTAHAVGFKTTSTIMFGHIDNPLNWARHLLRLRDLQEETGGFTEFVPLPFIHMEAPLYRKGRSRKGPTWREAVLMHAVGRLVLYPYITNIQGSWVKMGRDGVKALLNSGINDIGGTLINESISKAAGSSNGQEMSPQEMEQLIRAAGKIPQERNTYYEFINNERKSGFNKIIPVVTTVA